MLTLDTLKIEVPPHTIRGLNANYFIETTSVDGSTGQVQCGKKAKSASLPVGVSQINYKQGGSYQITMSAKTLRQDYLSGINLNTWEQAFSVLNPVIDIDFHSLWDANPKVYSLDTTDNIPLDAIGASKKDICNSLMASKKNQRFKTYPYFGKKQLAVEFRGTQEEKNRIVCYDKMLDLLHPKNRNFMKLIPNPSALMKDAESTIRFETNHTTFNSIRQRLKISDNTFQNVLKSKAPVNHDFLMKVISGRQTGQMTLFEEIKEFNGDAKEYVMMKGIKTIIEELNGDEKSLKEFFKIVYQKNFNYHYYKKPSSTRITRLLSIYKAEQLKTNYGHGLSICDKIFASLLKAVA